MFQFFFYIRQLRVKFVFFVASRLLQARVSRCFSHKKIPKNRPKAVRGVSKSTIIEDSFDL